MKCGKTVWGIRAVFFVFHEEGNDMDLMKYARSMERVLKRHCDDIVLLGEMEEDSVMWRFSMPVVVIDDMGKDTVYGVVSCETNEKDIGIPTVSISISLGEITGFSREKLFRLLAINGDLCGATLIVVLLPDKSKILFLGYRIPIEDFIPKEFGEYVADLLVQAMMFVPEEMDGWD